jgi:hypothetical protein
MSFLDWLFGGGSGGKSSNERLRQGTGRYGRKGQYRKVRNGDRVGRGPDGRYKK